MQRWLMWSSLLLRTAVYASSHAGWPRSFEAVVNDVEIANQRQDKGMVDPDPVRQHAHQNRHDRAPYDRHDHDSGSFARKRSQLRYAQGKNTGEHDGVK